MIGGIAMRTIFGVRVWRPWDGRPRVRMFHYFGLGDAPSAERDRRLAALDRQEARTYALEEFRRLAARDAAARGVT